MLIVMLPGVVLFEKVILPIKVMLVPGVVVFGVMTAQIVAFNGNKISVVELVPVNEP